MKSLKQDIIKEGKGEMLKYNNLQIEVNDDNSSLLNDYKKLANSITRRSPWIGRFPLFMFAITTFGTYYFYKKNKLKTAAVFGSIPMYFILQPIKSRLIKPFKEVPKN